LETTIKQNKEAVASREPTLQLPDGGKLKPDLVIKIQERVFMVDVTVHHEDGDILDWAHGSKLDKYAPIIEELKKRMGAEKGDVVPVVIGTRGVMPKAMTEALKKLNITTKKILITLSLIMLRNSINIYNNFMDYDVQQDKGEG
jgi:hypothetical protein